MKNRIPNSRDKIKKPGFTLAELLVVVTLFTTVILTSTTIYIHFNTADRKLKIENELYDETRFTLEKIVKEFREGTLDYEEYWNQANSGNCTLYSSGGVIYNETYGIFGNCYGNYQSQFYDSTGLNMGQNPQNADGITIEQSDKNAVSLTGNDNYQQDTLYLINNSGNKKTILRLENGHLQIKKLVGYDMGYWDGSDIIQATFNDGIIDTWVCAQDFICNGNESDGSADRARKHIDNAEGWVNISPQTLEITNLKFYIAPLEDPHKAYNEDSFAVQNQPHLTVMITAQTSEEKSRGIKGKRPEITLQTTVSSRVYNEVN